MFSVIFNGNMPHNFTCLVNHGDCLNDAELICVMFMQRRGEWRALQEGLPYIFCSKEKSAV